MTVLLATNNDHKRRELAQILTGHHISLPREIGIDFSFEESGTTFLENALGKAHALYDLLPAADDLAIVADDFAIVADDFAIVADDFAIVADDSGLCVDALGGAPGICSARYGSPDSGVTELPAAERNARLLGELGDATNREAHFVCCMVALFSANRYAVVQETFEGRIAREPSGGGGFGYDPIFFLPERGVTVAELPDNEKNLISHRGKAARGIAAILNVTAGRQGSINDA